MIASKRSFVVVFITYDYTLAGLSYIPPPIVATKSS